MPIACPGCLAALPDVAAFCSRCGRPTGSNVSVKETPESLLRQLASLLQQHSHRGLIVRFVGPWGYPHEIPKSKTKSLLFKSRKWIFEGDAAFTIAPISGRLLFDAGTWDDIRVRVFQETGFDDARRFAEAYRMQTARHVEILKKYG